MHQPAKPDVSRISGTTQVIALLGTPVSHSRSPVMQNTVFRAMGLNFVYVPFDIPLDRAAEAVSALRTLGIRGANVTMPLKRAVMAHLDRVSEAADLSGAVNVIVNDDGVLTGHITDGEGFMLSLAEAGVPHEGRRITLIGAGGAATAVAVQAAMTGAGAITFFNRDDPFRAEAVARAEALQQRFGCPVAVRDLSDTDALAQETAASDILINGTPVGMDDTVDRMPLPADIPLPSALTVCDLIYAPRETALLRHAARAGCRTVSGLGMQLYQAAPAFRLWTGQAMDMVVARRALFG